MKKTWTYSEVTQGAIAEIERLKREAAQSTGVAADMHRDWALGVFMFWNRITEGQQEPGDWERLHKLAGLNDD
ncbi:hypothetical protein BrE312_2436 [Brenneria sp. EniD312]|nr:hypothetical protein BrE312_2436 [Brenneria sp. EniD312]